MRHVEGAAVSGSALHWMMDAPGRSAPGLLLLLWCQLQAAASASRLQQLHAAALGLTPPKAATPAVLFMASARPKRVLHFL